MYVSYVILNKVTLEYYLLHLLQKYKYAFVSLKCRLEDFKEMLTIRLHS